MAEQIDLVLDSTAPPFAATASFDGVQRRLRVWWNLRSSAWTIDLLDIDGTAIVAGQPMIEGFPLLSRHKNTDSRVPAGDLWLIGSALVYQSPPE